MPSPLSELLCDSALPDTPAGADADERSRLAGDIADERVAQAVGVVGGEVRRVAAEADELAVVADLRVERCLASPIRAAEGDADELDGTDAAGKVHVAEEDVVGVVGVGDAEVAGEAGESDESPVGADARLTRPAVGEPAGRFDADQLERAGGDVVAEDVGVAA